MGTYQILLFIFAFVALFSTGLAVKCYECNVWKAGYGHLCENPRIREDCLTCMKTETTIFMGYYKNVPRSSIIVSRICGKSRTIRHSNQCLKKDIPGGTSESCYCSDDLCNAATRLGSSSLSWAALSLSVAVTLSMTMLNSCVRRH